MYHSDRYSAWQTIYNKTVEGYYEYLMNSKESIPYFPNAIQTGFYYHASRGLSLTPDDKEVNLETYQSLPDHFTHLTIAEAMYEEVHQSFRKLRSLYLDRYLKTSLNMIQWNSQSLTSLTSLHLLNSIGHWGCIGDHHWQWILECKLLRNLEIFNNYLTSIDGITQLKRLRSFFLCCEEDLVRDAYLVLDMPFLHLEIMYDEDGIEVTVEDLLELKKESDLGIPVDQPHVLIATVRRTSCENHNHNL